MASSGDEAMSGGLAKACVPGKNYSVPEILEFLINESLEKGVFADKWKTAIIKPLLKKVDLELICKNYRPVSNLSFLSKILEKCALLQFDNHCTENNLLLGYQSAYREHLLC